MWALIAEAAVLVGVYVYHRWFQDQPATLQWQSAVLPRTAEGTPLPLIYGTTRVRNPVLVWQGNSLSPGLEYDPFNGSPQTGGTRTAGAFSIDLLFVLGIPPYSPPNPLFSAGASLDGIWYGDAKISSLTVATVPGGKRFYGGPGTLGSPDINKFSIAGVFYAGDTQQFVPFDAIDSGPYAFGLPIPGMFPDLVVYQAGGPGATSLRAAVTQAGDIGNMGGLRNQTCAWMHVALGQSPTMSGFSFEVRAPTNFTASDLGVQDWRSPTGLHISLSAECDPAAVLYDILTSPWGKLGIDRNRIDIVSFQAASQVLFNEFNGYSRYIDQATDASQIIQELLQQMDAVLFEEPTTGQLTLRLIRFDYTAALLDEINPSNAMPEGSGWYSVQSWAEVPNQVKITWTNRNLSYQDAIAVAQDPVVAIANGGRLRTASLSFPGVCTSTLAQRIASRELNAMSRPMVKATVSVSRAFYAHRPGDVVRFRWPDLGIDNMVMRIAGMDYGQLHDAKIVMQLMRDVFDVQTGGFPYLR